MPEPEGTILADEPAKTEPPVVWKDTIAEEHLKIVDRFTEPKDLAKGYCELMKSHDSRVKLPTEESTEEERSAFYEKLGRPDNPDGYELNIPDTFERDAEFEGTMRNIAFKTGAPKAQFEALVKNYYEFMTNRLNRTREEGEKSLRELWGNDYDPNMEITKRAYKHFGSDDFTALLNKTGLGNHPVIVKTFYEIAKVNLNDTLIKGTQTTAEEYKPRYPNSPEMYAHGDDEESKKGRAWHEARGHKY